MRYRMQNPFVLFLLIFSCIGARSEWATYPKVFIEHGISLDLQACPSGISDLVLNEVTSNLPEFQALWGYNESSLLGSTVEIVGKSFSRKEETVSVLVCPSLKGQAQPILIPIWPYLNSTTNGQPFDRLFFVGITFHELLHRYVDKVFGGMNPSTPLLQKYGNENILVRRHLHVLALQRAVYLHLGRENEINAIAENDSRYFGSDYARAWAIVNSIEGIKHCVAELR
jgi:hypothetical protein